MDSLIFENIFRDSLITKIDTEQFLTKYYSKLGYNIFKSAEYAQNNILNFLEFAYNNISSSNKHNIPCIFSFVSKEVVLINADFFEVKDIHQRLLKIDWRDFELISGDILEVCFSAYDVRVTQATADGGLDFEGKLPISSLGSKLTYGFIEVYGQSKKYSGNVGIYEIKSFVAFANSKKRNYVHPAQLFMFFTTSDYAQNAILEMETNGFIGLSGFQLAHLIFNYKNLLVNKNEIFKYIANAS